MLLHLHLPVNTFDKDQNFYHVGNSDLHFFKGARAQKIEL